MKIQFTQPIYRFGRWFSVGDQHDCDPDAAKTLIRSGYAVAVESDDSVSTEVGVPLTELGLTAAQKKSLEKLGATTLEDLRALDLTSLSKTLKPVVEKILAEHPREVEEKADADEQDPDPDPDTEAEGDPQTAT